MADSGHSSSDTERSWVDHVRSVCPECGLRGSAQGIRGIGKWMTCSNGHEWGYEDV